MSKYDFETIRKSVEEAEHRSNYYNDFDSVDRGRLHQIADLMHWIRTKVRGADVREVIAQLFERMYIDMTAKGNANFEVSESRGSFDKLADRLKAVDELIKSKADDAAIMSMINNIVDGSPQGTYPNIGALRNAKPQGDKGIYITTDNKHWNYWNGSNWISGGVYSGASVSPFDTFAFVAGNIPVNFNNKSKQVEVLGNNTLMVSGNLKIIRKGNTSYPTSPAWLIYNMNSESLSFTGNPSSTDVVLGGIFETHKDDPEIFFNGLHTINSQKPITKDKIADIGNKMLFSFDNIYYNPPKRTLTIPKINVIIGSKEEWVEGHDVVLTDDVGFIIYDRANKKFIPGGAADDPRYPVFGYWDHNKRIVYMPGKKVNTVVKKLACLGDSITEGVHADGWQWHRYIGDWANKNGIQTSVVNLGIGGTSVCTSSYVTAQLQPFVNRLNTIPEDADIITIFGGTNDWGNNAVLGSITDTGTHTFYGAYKHILEWLAVNRPNAKVLTITPLKRYYRGGGSEWHNAQTTPNAKGNLLQDYVRAVKEVSNLYAVPCVDLHNESGLNPEIQMVRDKYIWDGLHPTGVGNKRMYPVILDKMRPMLEHE